MATLKDVAARAEVSVATAARVLRADPALVVRPETRARVQAAAAALAYHPNSAARGLRTRRSGTLAVFLPDPQNIMWLEMLRGVERAAAARDYLVVVADAHGPTLDPDQLGRLVLERRVDGLLVAFARVHDELVDQIASEALPFVAVNSQSATIAGAVTMDDAAGSRLAVEHLAGLGHRRIAFIGGRPRPGGRPGPGGGGPGGAPRPGNPGPPPPLPGGGQPQGGPGPPPPPAPP